jgi:hypothetical protein
MHDLAPQHQSTKAFHIRLLPGFSCGQSSGIKL